ncbi:Uncharacterised protein [Shigella sonnei]|nr:Uncharacterised protein [Shigella sonnei]
MRYWFFAAVLSKPTNGQFLTGDRQKHALLNLSHVFAVDVGIVSAGWFVLNRGGRADKCHCDAIFPAFFIAVAEFSIKHAFWRKVVNNGQIDADGFFKVVFIIIVVIHCGNAAGDCNR